ncbi:hypothetical protein EV586_105217 [Tumebacillus sp. BK434]|uniref:protein DpdD n=1 Tax=Tumebacillus sp. BK434 TaxID=2512169 RepID=UPI00105080BC|nr:protein DpdD [Tumebacillus sp. BK434]TCP53871.1 hypothetical protein EV586_105217 [Tumebacillus sp. BK434]
MSNPRKDWFSRFYDPAFNGITLKRLEQNELMYFTSRIAQDPPQPTILPFKPLDGNRVYWYGVAFSEEDMQWLGEQLQSFIGVSYSDFQGRRAVPNPSLAFDQMVNGLTEGRYYRFHGNSAEITATVVLMGQLWRKGKSSQKVDVSKTVGRLLRDFYVAVQVGQRSSAEELLNELKARHYVNADNLLFLRVHMLTGMEKWDEVVQLRQMGTLLALKRPQRVTESLIQAVYHHFLAKWEHQPAKVLDVFRDEVWPQFGALYTHRGQMQSPEALKSFMLRAVAVQPVQLLLCNEILATPSLDAKDRQFLEAVSQFLPQELPPHHMTEMEKAQADFSIGSYESALRWLKPTRCNLEAVQYGIQIAFKLRTTEAREYVSEMMGQLSVEEHQQLKSSKTLQSLLEQIFPANDTEEEAPPSGWLDWLERVENQQQVKFFDLVYLNPADWPEGELLNSADHMQRFIDGMDRCFNKKETQDLVFSAVPHALELLKRDPRWPNERLQPVYLKLIEWIILSTNGHVNDFYLLYELTEGLLKTNISDSVYETVLYAAVDMFTDYGDFPHLNWAMEYLEMIFLNQCPRRELRVEYLQLITEKFRQYKRHVSYTQWELLKLLYQDFGMEAAWPALVQEFDLDRIDLKREVSIWAKLSGRTVGLYTLTRQVARKVESMIQSHAPDSKFIVDHSKVNTASLETLADASDLLIISWQSAKHAATVSLADRYSTRGRQPIYPEGKGSSGIIRALHEYLERHDR